MVDKKFDCETATNVCFGLFCGLSSDISRGQRRGHKPTCANARPAVQVASIAIIHTAALSAAGTVTFAKRSAVNAFSRYEVGFCTKARDPQIKSFTAVLQRD